ncbi:hypothetical protein SAY86_009761 [Trapa natans]|uniref:Uncharacterized protein n=1 Tax=Trapa natans TaxID=22666 RepID=A0AAN7QRH4_TRANT|nr:hypothetical protein SAY86_009761 [Trapa natans]
MVRGKVQLKRIENKVNRQVTFSKRRTGLLKKAHEISVLCDAEVALIVFSTKGKLFEYSSDSSMDRILERYERYSYAAKQSLAGASESIENWPLENAKIKARVEVLQKNQRNLMGEDLDCLSLRELQNLEQQLDSGLKHIRSKKNQLMHESIAELQRKDKALQEQNNLLAKKVKEKGKAVMELEPVQDGSLSSGYTTIMAQPPLHHPVTIFGVPNSHGGGSEDAHFHHPRNGEMLLPPWMLRPLNG